MLPTTDKRCKASPGLLIGAATGNALSTRAAVDAGVDLLFALSAAALRQHGAGPMAPFLPHRNANDLTEALLEGHLLRERRETPIVAGMLASDPFEALDARLDRWKSWGIAGVTNYPTVGFLDGVTREAWTEEGASLDAEVELLERARACGLSVVAFVVDDESSVERFAKVRPDLWVLSPGVTRLLADADERSTQLKIAITKLDGLQHAVRATKSKAPRLAFGGPLTTPEDLEHLIRQSAFDGFVGGSAFERIPVQASISSTIRRFRSVSMLERSEASKEALGPIIGGSPAMQTLFRRIERAASYDLHVYVEGESATGKELVATQIHRLSPRAHGPFVTLNCGAIPDSLLESELFGHEKGAFTGADRRRLGKFELAHGGTLLLDEIADLSPRGQVALLRAIQQSEITRVGGEESLPVDVRIIAASGRPLTESVEDGNFRGDLYYRLNNLTLRVPPLRERTEDIPRLVERMLESLRIRMNRELDGVSDRFLEALVAHRWPGNVRELEHVLSQAALVEDGALLDGLEFLPDRPSFAGAGTRSSALDDIATTARRERSSRVQRAIAEAGGNKSLAARALGVSRKTLYAWLRESE